MFQRLHVHSKLMSAVSTENVLAPAQEKSLISRPTVQTAKQGLRYGEILLIVAILIVAGLAHGIGMFNNPSYLGDEGIYMSQAWAVLREGRLDPYTYTYGHTPVGWMQIAAWIWLVGSFHTFGTTIETGRVFMLVLQIGSTFLLYCIARNISRSVVVATLACLLFALSPYAIYLHRRVLLDNIMTFWMLLSIVFLLFRRLSLNYVWLSALAFGIAIMSKENAIFLTPVLAYLVFDRADKSHRWFATIGWLTLAGSIFSTYLLMATLKGELFPPGTLLGGKSDHVSLLGSVGWQAGREKDGGFFDLSSKFWHIVSTWVHAEAFLMLAGILFALISVLLIKKYRLVGIMGLATFSLWLFLIRGSLVLEFYLAPELPFMALNIALVLGTVVSILKTFLQNFPGLSSVFRAPLLSGVLPGKRSEEQIAKTTGVGGPRRAIFVHMSIGTLQVIMVGLCLMGILAEYSSPVLRLQQDPLRLWTGSDGVATQKDAIHWVETHVPPCSSLIIDPSMWTDLHDIPGKGYRLAHSYWQADLDPTILDGVFHNDWHNVDYVILTPGLAFDARVYDLKLAEDAIKNSTQIASFSAAPWHVDILQVRKGTLKPGLGCSGLN